MNEIIFKEFKIQHVLKKSLKHSYISIKPTADEVVILLKTPKVSGTFIENLLREKESWIRKHILKIQESKQKEILLEDEVLLFGEIYSIDSEEATSLREKLNKTTLNNQSRVLKHYEEFYKSKAREYLSQRLEHFSQIMNLDYEELKFRKMKSRWGSCSSKRTITLNTELVKVKKELIDYVLVHELAHLVHMNHSREFHTFVDLYVENSKEIRKELKNVYLGVGVK